MSSVSRCLAVLVAVNILPLKASAEIWREVAVPSQTAQVIGGGGMGLPFYEAMPMPTSPPARALVKRRLDARVLAETNTCAEWTILGGGVSEDYGQPICSSSQTCIFTTDGNSRYEGCGRQNVNYDWITECHNYAATTTASEGASILHCPSSIPSCTTFQFVFSAGLTYTNLGCDTTALTLLATLVDKTGPVPTIEAKRTGSTIDALQPTNAGTTPKSTGTANGEETKSSLGVIVGGAVGGVVVLAITGFLAWFCLRKRKREKVEQEKAATAATEVAYHNLTYTAEMEGTVVGEGVTSAHSTLRGVFAPRKVGEGGGVVSPSGLSPPPVYGQVGELEGRPSELESRTSTAGRVEIGAGAGGGLVEGEMQKPPPVVRERERGRQQYQQQRGVDMNGAPMRSDWRPQ